jgi:hypothetical protein
MMLKACGSLALMLAWTTSSSSHLAAAQETSDLPELDWYWQVLPAPYGGQHTGVATYDVNQDGYADLVFAAGRHGVDQSFIHINLGFDELGYFRFSEALPIGEAGSFYETDVRVLSQLAEGHVGVLLGGGSCNDPELCAGGVKEPAVVLDVVVSGCSALEPDVPCHVESSIIWQDPHPTGDRSAAFHSDLGDGADPAIVLVGEGGITIYEPTNGQFGSAPAFTLTTAEKTGETGAFIRRASSIAMGMVGDNPGFVTGVRTYTAPNPLIAVFKDPTGAYDWFHFGDDSDTYGNARGFTEGTGLAMGDIDGDGTIDVAEASFLNPAFLEDGVDIPQFYYLMNKTPQDADTIPGSTLFSSETPGYSITMDNIYGDSDLPDIVHGMLDGSVRIFANKGTTDGAFNGFRAAATLNVPPQCQIRDMEVVSLSPCTISIVMALVCQSTTADAGNYVFSAETDCAFEPTASPWPSMSPWPTSTAQPSVVASSAIPSALASKAPSLSLSASVSESQIPSVMPAEISETQIPSVLPVEISETQIPSKLPSPFPTKSPVDSPTNKPSTSFPSASPSYVPSNYPSPSPTRSPTRTPSASPSVAPSTIPSDFPSFVPSLRASEAPSRAPSVAPSGVPSDYPSLVPSLYPTDAPSSRPSVGPSSEPSNSPSDMPTSAPSPTTSPTRQAIEAQDPPTSNPTDYIEASNAQGLDNTPQAEDKQSSTRTMLLYVALGISILMIIVGCAGIVKALLLHSKMSWKDTGSENSGVFSIYLDDATREDIRRLKNEQ